MTIKPIASVSIIIPTLNEAEYLPKLLRSIKRQTIQPLEVIVADANSTDATQQIAQSAGCIVIEGGMPGVGRNAGARVAQGDYLFFLDSDVILPPTFIELALKEFEDKYLDAAAVDIEPISSKHVDKLFFKIQRSLMIQLQDLYPFTIGAAILTTKRMYQRIGGFNEKMRLGEDNDYGNRARKIGRCGVVTSTHIQLSVRRQDKVGRIQFFQDHLRHQLFKQLKSLGIAKEIEYEFGNYTHTSDPSAIEQFLENVLTFVDDLKPTTPEKKFPKTTPRQ
jgi:glycosyltransferase involved in cell wall biosynthesis